LIKIKLKRQKDGTLKEGIKVDLSDKPDKVYISVIFKKNKQVVDDFVSQHSDITFDIGGSGYDLHKTLPDEIENMAPDYSLYPDCDYSLGFSSRGCIRNKKTCHFCIVPEKEGNFKRVQHPENWYNSKFEKITFFDNNILADREWFYEITDWCAEKKLKLCFNQGLDIRLMDSDIAKRIMEMKTHSMINFAWDHIEDEEVIREKIALLKTVGFSNNKFRAKVQFYVYVNDDSEYDSGLYRCNELKKLSCNAFVMYNVDNERSRRIKDLQRWANRRGLFWQFNIEKYKRSIDAGNAKRLHGASE
jgi:hypothetical protein